MSIKYIEVIHLHSRRLALRMRHDHIFSFVIIIKYKLILLHGTIFWVSCAHNDDRWRHWVDMSAYKVISSSYKTWQHSVLSVSWKFKNWSRKVRDFEFHGARCGFGFGTKSLASRFDTVDRDDIFRNIILISFSFHYSCIYLDFWKWACSWHRLLWKRSTNGFLSPSC